MYIVAQSRYVGKGHLIPLLTFVIGMHPLMYIFKPFWLMIIRDKI